MTQVTRGLALLLALALLATACGTRVTEEVAARAVADRGTGAGQPGDVTGPSTGSVDDPGFDIDDGDDADDTAPGGAAAETGESPEATGESGGPTTGGNSAGPANPPGGTAAPPDDGPVTVSGEPSQGISDDEIRIGVDTILSGVIGFIGEEMVAGLDSYIQLVNAQGGIDGRRIRLIVYDNQNDPQLAASNVRRLVERDKVFALATWHSDPIADYVTRLGIPTFVLGITAPPFASKYPTMYPMAGNMLLWGHDLIAGLKDQDLFEPGMRVAIQYETETFDGGPYLPYLEEAWDLAGAEVVSTDPLNLSDGDCTSLVLKMRQLDIDYWDFNGAAWIFCASAAQRQGYKPNIGWGSWASSVGGLTNQVGPWVDGLFGGGLGDNPFTGAPRTLTDDHRQYVQALRRYHPDVANNDIHLESPITMSYWVTGKLIAQRLAELGGPLNWDRFNPAIQATTPDNFDAGITPPVLSLRPDCKRGTEVVWAAQWRWDHERNTAYRQPETGYFTSPFKHHYGGDCFLTKLSDELLN